LSLTETIPMPSSSRVCPVCGLSVKEEDRFKIRSFSLKMVALKSAFMMKDGQVITSYHKSCLREDESEWVRNGRGVVISKGEFVVYRSENGGMLKARR